MRIFYFDSTKTNEPCDTAQPSIILYCSTAPNETIKTFTKFGTTGIIRHYEDSFLSGETQNHPGKPYRKFAWKTKIHIFRIKQRRNNGKLWLNLVLASPSDSSSQPTKKRKAQIPYSTFRFYCSAVVSNLHGNSRVFVTSLAQQQRFVLRGGELREWL